MKNLIYIVYSLLVFASCGSKNEEKAKLILPPNIVNRETMVSLMTDLAMFEASKNLNLIQPKDTTGKPLAIDSKLYQEVIYKKYGLTVAQFDTNYAFYSSHTEEMDQIYQDALSEMSRIQAEASK